MSVGFVGSSYQSLSDISSSGARLDASLQGVLSKYDSIKTDLDRLSNNASFNVYDLTSRQQYNAYNNESQNGWSESWYSEYKAVLQLRADALKKKLERSYNQVLEKSVFTEIEPDNNSVFAPYANRTASLTQTDFQTPVSEILVKDVAIGSVATVAPPATPTSVVFDSILDYLKAPSARINSTTTITQAIADPGATLASNTVNPASTLFSSIPALKQGQYEALYNAISDSFVTATYVDGNGVTQTGIPNPPTTNPQKKKAKLVSDSVISMFAQLSTAVVPGLPAGMNLMDYYLPYGRVGSIKTLLAAGTITLPAAGSTISGYQPASYYGGAPFVPALLPLPGIGVFDDATLVNPPVAINTPSQSQSQNAAETNPGYLFDVDFSSTAASTMTINGVNAAGGSVGASSPVSVFSLTTPAAPPTIAASAVGSLETTGKVYKRSLGIDDSVSGDFIQYGLTPSTITVYIDDLPASASAVGAQVISLMNDAAGSKLGGFDSGTGSNVTLTQLPPPGKTVVFRSKFPTSWYYNNDPRLGLKSGVGTNAPNVNVDDYIDRATNPYHAEPDGLYTMLRNAGASAPPSTPPGAGVTPAPTAPPPTAPLGVPSNPTELKYDDAYEKAIGNADLNSNKNYSNIRDQLPMYGTGVILDPDEIFKGMPPSVKDTMLKDPNIMADLTASMNSMVNSFVGREYDDIVGGNYYDGEFECSDSSPLIMLSTMSGPSAVYISSLPEAYMPSSSLLYAGGGTIWGLLPTPAPTSVVTIGIGPDANFGHLSAVNDAGGFVTPIPTVGLFSVGMNVPIPLPYPLAPLTIWAGARTQKTHDVAAEFIEKFLAAVKPLVVEAVQTQAYSASSGSAFDTYASRGEYHFSTPGYLESMKKLKLEVFGIEIPIGDMIESFIKGGGLARASLVGLGNAGWGQAAYGTDINGASAGTRLFDYQQSNQGAEARETDSGAFFATQSFLSQFEMKNMESEYWIGTQQNEEVVNNDMLRALQTAGGQIMSMMTRTLAAAATAGNLNPLAGALLKVIVDAIDAMNAKATQEMWYKMLYGDIDYQGSGLGSNGWIKGEGYDYIEDDHKPFEADSDFNYPDPPPMNLGTMVAGILGADASMFTAKKPNFIMDGYSATRRFRKATDTSDAIESITTLALTPTDASQENGFGARSHAGRGAASPSGTDDGLWQDTALGDINEVYVGRRKVVFNNLDQGFGSFESATITGAGSNITNTGAANGTNVSAATNVSTATRQTYAYADRYTGADTRAYGRRYDGGTPINFESFNTGMYSDGVNTGSRYHYDRRNEYSLSFQTAASNNVVNLQGSQALNPSIGGFIKMGEIDKNKTDDALLQYESIDQATLFKTSAVSDHVLNLSTQTRGVNEQKFGASADGELNDLNKTLYEAMHLRADGRNLSEFNQYRDVFNMGFMKNIFISGQSYHPSGGGVTSSIEIRYDSFSGTQSVQTDTRENYDSNTNFDPYNALSLNKSRGKASIYLNNYFAYKKRANKK